MKRTFHTVGPTQLFPEVRDYITEAIDNDVPSISHRSGDFEQIYSETTANIRKLLEIPESYMIFFISSGTECMERIIQNLVERNCFHFVNGAFSKRFYTTAKELGKNAGKTESAYGEGFVFADVTIPEPAELICLTQNETSTGVALSMGDIYNLKRTHPEKLIAVDVVTGAPYIKVVYDMIDCAFFSVQKGFGLPGGLGVLIANERCIEKTRELREKGVNIGSYHNFITLAENADKNQTAITPNVLDIFLLGKVSALMLEKGIGKIREETEKKAHMIYDAFRSDEKLYPFVENETDRSMTTIVLEAKDDNSGYYRDKLLKEDIVVSQGYKEYKEKQIRIGNFPMHTEENMRRLIEIIKE